MSGGHLTPACPQCNSELPPLDLSVPSSVKDNFKLTIACARNQRAILDGSVFSLLSAVNVQLPGLFPKYMQRIIL